MEIKIKYCIDCPFIYEYDMSEGFGCKLDTHIRGLMESMKNKKTIKQNKKTWLPDTPDWCPIKSQTFTFELKK